MNEANGRYVEHLIIGAGMSGLCAAAALKSAGHPVTVVDKGRGVGGRMATRRLGAATLDHGAQFVTARTERFERWIREAGEAGAAREWSRGFPPTVDGHPRWCGVTGMSGLAKHLAASLDVELGKQVAAVSRSETGWKIRMTDGEEWIAGTVILTAPVPQSVALLDAGGVALDANTRAQLAAIQYERCFAVMAVLGGPSKVPAPGGFVPEHGPLAWVADNQQKGISTEPAVTLHATDAYSLENWERDRNEVAKELLAAAEPWIGSEIRQYEIHGWRYSRPVTPSALSCVVLEKKPALVLAGDAFGGARVEGAALSGWSAAEAVSGI
jgi:predicted NAD/FAD-dependent oxidoreductase